MIEILIAVIFLVILATVIIPQLSISGEDARLNNLKTDLCMLRNAIELYYFQHGNIYPGYIRPADGGLKRQDGRYFSNQLTRYTSIDGIVSDTKDDTYRFGPYLNGGALPMNHYNGDNNLVINYLNEDIAFRNSSGPGGWKFCMKTGILIANDGEHDAL